MKFSLEFPDAPSGTIESLTLHAMSAIASQDPSTKSVTFDTGAMEDIIGGRNMGEHKLAALKKSYETINKSLKSTNKSEFGAKLGAKDERVFVAYPKGGLGMTAILGFWAPRRSCRVNYVYSLILSLLCKDSGLLIADIECEVL